MTTPGMFANFKETNLGVTRALFEKPLGSRYHLRLDKAVLLFLRVLPKRILLRLKLSPLSRAIRRVSPWTT